MKKNAHSHGGISPDGILDVTEDLLGGRELVVHHRMSRITSPSWTYQSTADAPVWHTILRVLSFSLPLSVRLSLPPSALPPRTARPVATYTAVRHFTLRKRYRSSRMQPEYGKQTRSAARGAKSATSRAGRARRPGSPTSRGPSLARVVECRLLAFTAQRIESHFARCANFPAGRFNRKIYVSFLIELHKMCVFFKFLLYFINKFYAF